MERSHQTLVAMTRTALFDSGLHPKFWCYAMEHQTKVYNAVLNEATQDHPEFLWTGKRTDANELRVWGCEIFPMSNKPAKLDSRVQHGYYMGTTATSSIFKWWDPDNPGTIKYCHSAKFNELSTKLPDGSTSPGCSLTPVTRKKLKESNAMQFDVQKHPYILFLGLCFFQSKNLIT